MSDEITQKVIGNVSNAFTQALVTLDKCLLNNGALKPGQFSEALKSTFNHPDADWERLDYTILRMLAKEIDDAEVRDRRGWRHGG